MNAKRREELIAVKGLKTDFTSEGVPMRIIDNVSFEIYRGEALGVVGESGSGKSVTARCILRLIPSPPGRIVGGTILFEGRDILSLSMEDLRHIRGNEISMIFQEPMSSLNPVFTCGSQIIEAITLHQKLDKRQAREKAIETLRLAGIQLPEERVDCYPHELSGGMRQRVMIAMALSCVPKLLIADEPTTALDPTIQAQILDLIRNLQKEMGMSVLYITHDLGVVAETCDRVMVMYAGQILEKASVQELFQRPTHPYTQGLLKSVPRLNARKKERLHTIEGMVPHFAEMPKGCSFQPRCPCASEQCGMQRPTLETIGPEHEVACWEARRQTNPAY